MLFHTASARQPNREWIDYDGHPPEQSASSAIKALLEFRAQPHQSGGKFEIIILKLNNIGLIMIGHCKSIFVH